MPDTYRIRVQGHLDGAWTHWFDGFTIANRANGEAELRGAVPDQAALHGVLTKVRDLGLPLVSVARVAARASSRSRRSSQSSRPAPRPDVSPPGPAHSTEWGRSAPL